MGARGRGARRIGSSFRKAAISSAVKIFIRLLPFIAALAVIAAAGAVVIYFVRTSDYFTVKNIKIVGERIGSDARPIWGDMDLKKGINIFTVDLKTYESQIEGRFPQMKNLKVKRVMPDTLEIVYETRRPFCQIDSGGLYYMVSDDGVVLPQPSAIERPDLRVITGVAIPSGYQKGARRYNVKAIKKAISLFNEIDETGFNNNYRVVRIDIYDTRNPALILEDDTRIEMGEQSFKEKYRLLKEVLNDLAAKNKKAKAIDLRFKDVVVLPR